VAPRTGLDAVVRRKILSPYRHSNPRSCRFQKRKDMTSHIFILIIAVKVAGPCEHDNETSGSIQVGKFVD
jgi:hypothetical protein